MLNRFIGIGRLAADPEIKYTPNGTAVANYPIAIQRDAKASGQDKPETDFFDTVSWGKLAETSANYLKKGKLVAIEGRGQIRSWVAQDGTKRKAFEIVVDRMTMLDKAEKKEEPAPQPAPEPTGTMDYEDPFADE